MGILNQFLLQKQIPFEVSLHETGPVTTSGSGNILVLPQLLR